MRKGISLHIGLNRLDPEVYPRWTTLLGAENDAVAMQQIALNLGYRSTLLLSEEARADTIMSSITSAAGELVADDIFFITFSGHGRKIQGSRTEPFNQSWVAYERQIIDDELYCAWQSFASGVRVVVVSDSCFSGSILDLAFTIHGPDLVAGSRNLEIAQGPGVIGGRIKAPSEEQAMTHLLKYARLYRGIAEGLAPCRELPPSGAMVLLLAACRDDQLAIDGPEHGAFTESLLCAYKSGSFADYPEFFRLIIAGISAQQTPQYYALSQDIQPLEQRRPFDI